MKFTFSSLVASALLITAASAAGPVKPFKGFNLGANNAQGACKSPGDYMGDFSKIKSWPGGFNAVRLFSSGAPCYALDNAIPAAKKYGIKILVGVWANPNPTFESEKAALWAAINKYGTSWIAGISVGSEDLYRNTQSDQLHLDPNTLAGYIRDVRGMVQQKSKSLLVGHTDTWTAWVNGANNVVTQACDFVVTDGYPYWQGTPIGGGEGKFFESVNAVANFIRGVKNQAVWIGETGWPTGGSNFGQSHPSIPNLQAYWKAVGCRLQRENWNFFWFSAFDAPKATPAVEAHFGVAYSGRSLKINLQC